MAKINPTAAKKALGALRKAQGEVSEKSDVVRSVFGDMVLSTGIDEDDVDAFAQLCEEIKKGGGTGLQTAISTMQSSRTTSSEAAA